MLLFTVQIQGLGPFAGLSMAACLRFFSNALSSCRTRSLQISRVTLAFQGARSRFASIGSIRNLEFQRWQNVSRLGRIWALLLRRLWSRIWEGLLRRNELKRYWKHSPVPQK